MVYSGLQLDEHVIHIGLHCVTNLFPDHLVDKMLVGCSGILETEQHDLIIVEPAVCNEGSVFLIGYMHRDLVVPRISLHEA